MKSYSDIIDEEFVKAKAAGKPVGSVTDITHRFTGGGVILHGKSGKKKPVKK